MAFKKLPQPAAEPTCQRSHCPSSPALTVWLITWAGFPQWRALGWDREVTSDLWTAKAPLSWLALKRARGAPRPGNNQPPTKEDSTAGCDLYPHSLLEDSLVEQAGPSPSSAAKHPHAFWVGHVTWNLHESYGFN